MIIKFDTKIWAHPAVYAREKEVTESAVLKWIERKQIEYKKYDDYKLTIVKRGSEAVGSYSRKKA